MEELQFLAIQWSQKVWGYDYSFWQNTRMWQTDRQTDTTWLH